MTETHAALLERAMRAHYAGQLGLRPRQLEAAYRSRREMVRGRRLAATLDREVGLAGKLVLDVGSGWGEVTYHCRQRGATAFGVEPSAESLRVAGALASEQGGSWFTRGVGERLPFRTGALDVVVCHHVIEHVRDVAEVLAELVRVVRPGGHVLLAFPNYAYPFEGHYRLPLVPVLPKRAGAWVLRALGRDPAFLLTSVNYVTERGIARLLRTLPVEARLLSADKPPPRTLSGFAADALRRVSGARPTVTLLLRRR